MRRSKVRVVDLKVHAPLLLGSATSIHLSNYIRVSEVHDLAERRSGV